MVACMKNISKLKWNVKCKKCLMLKLFLTFCWLFVSTLFMLSLVLCLHTVICCTIARWGYPYLVKNYCTRKTYIHISFISSPIFPVNFYLHKSPFSPFMCLSVHQQHLESNSHCHWSWCLILTLFNTWLNMIKYHDI